MLQVVRSQPLTQYQLADASPIPIIIYSYPAVCAGINMSSDVIIRVGQHPNVAGVKHTDHDIGKIARESRAEYTSTYASGFVIRRLMLGRSIHDSRWCYRLPPWSSRCGRKGLDHGDGQRRSSSVLQGFRARHGRRSGRGPQVCRRDQ
jgi:hypothetical protein